MFETKTYEALLASALARVSSGIDKREGSMVMNGVAPSMAELAQLYMGWTSFSPPHTWQQRPVNISSSGPLTVT